MSIVLGSARHDEYGKYVGGKAGDQNQKSSTNDTVGEVSMQNFYIHKKGWYVIRMKSITHANAVAEKMQKACNNQNIGYDQGGRQGIVTYGTGSTTKTECDCSSLAREVFKEATGKDPGNFTTVNAVSAMEATGLVEKHFSYTTATVLHNGDFLVTKTKGHIVAVVSGNPRKATSGTTNSTSYTKAQFVRDVQSCTGSRVDGDPGSETIGNTPTVSETKNKHHAVVTPLERRLKALGFYNGAIEADQGKTPSFGAGMTAAVNAFQKSYGGRGTDGEVTAKGKCWQHLLGML